MLERDRRSRGSYLAEHHQLVEVPDRLVWAVVLTDAGLPFFDGSRSAEGVALLHRVALYKQKAKHMRKNSSGGDVS